MSTARPGERACSFFVRRGAGQAPRGLRVPSRTVAVPLGLVGPVGALISLRMRKGRLNRAVGIFIALTAGGAAALLWFAVAAGGPALSESPAHGLFFGFWSILYNTDAPAPRIILAAIAMALLLAAGVAALDRRIANRSRRSLDPLTGPLAPRVVMSATRGVYAGPVKVTVLIPAHNEDVSLPLTIASLLEQSRRPDRVIVVADNCSDSTVFLAREAGVEVIESVNNTQKKAGA